MQRSIAAGSLEDITMRASVEEATWRPLGGIGERTVASRLTTIIWYLMTIIITALAIHRLVRKHIGGTNRLVVRGPLRRGELESVTKVGIETGMGIEIGTGGIETDMNEIETVNGIANGTVTTAVTRTLSDHIVDSCPLYFALHFYVCSNSTQPQ